MIQIKEIDNTQWAIYYEMIFKINGKFYVTEYSEAAIDYLNEIPYKYDDDVIECDVVFPEKKTIIVYEG